MGSIPTNTHLPGESFSLAAEVATAIVDARRYCPGPEEDSAATGGLVCVEAASRPRADASLSTLPLEVREFAERMNRFVAQAEEIKRYTKEIVDVVASILRFKVLR